MRLWTVQPVEVAEALQRQRIVDGPWLPHSLSHYSPQATPAVTWMAYELYRRKVAASIGGMFWHYVSTREEVLESLNRGTALLEAGPAKTFKEWFRSDPGPQRHDPRPTRVLTLDVPESECVVSSLELWETAMHGIPIARTREEDAEYAFGDPVSIEVMQASWRVMFDRGFTAAGLYGPEESWLWQATTSVIRREWLVSVEEIG